MMMELITVSNKVTTFNLQLLDSQPAPCFDCLLILNSSH
jgi:hypothetical protein